MVCVRTTSPPLLAAALVAAVAVACSLGSGAYAAEQEAAGAGGNDLRLRQPPITRGLSFDFYKRSCPRAESIVRDFVRDAVRKDIGLAAGLLRLHFHDCFVPGCDASVLLDGSATRPGEQQARPNLTLRPSAFKAINDIRDRLERECHGAVVSCSDILALAARDSVVATGGPMYRVPLGRCDSSRFATQDDVLSGLPRLHFHDCFVQGCDASVLLDGSATGPGEQQAPPNLTLRPSAFKAINDIQDRLERECRGAIVSCSDILALAARDYVVASGGPEYRVPLGRRDNPRFATPQDVLSGLPAPTSTVPSLLNVLGPLGLDATDLVALSGGHTVGLGHCTSFEDRLFPRPDPTMSPSFLGRLKRTCPAKSTDRRTVLDVRTPDVFDNKYYVNLVNREGLFVSDQDLFTNDATRPVVERFARSQRYFFNQFGVSMVKMGQIKVLTGDQGQVRRNCSARNPGIVDGLQWSSFMQTVVDATAEILGF